MKMVEKDLREGLLLGIGNPLLDISAVVDMAFVEKYGMKPNDAILATDKHQTLYKELINNYKAEYTAGGSVQNALRVAQWVLEKPEITTFFGCVGKDDYSKILERKARECGVNVQYQYCDNEPTGTCAVLITGKERSLCANLAAANHFTSEHVHKPENKKYIEIAKFYYISGFFLTVNPATVQEVANHALANDRMFVMNLSAPFVPQFYMKPLMDAMPYVDILFGNETEAATFAKEQNFGTDDLKKIALMICDLPKHNKNRLRVCIITQGENPVIMASNGAVKEFPAIQLPPEKVVDTNGAGDAFAGGFLAQLVLGRNYDDCVKCGIRTATEIIQRSGCTY
ncbi:adenosine kinase isoform X2 [Agrilus planipennis]|uniref:Adenosine kinase n=1 Tax=Agrilus planipennis TaxID=224129 RepID=A0A1W4XE72_AGRPL|nr:adenosine kinase isoform X1 [Agrilus planipennis]XP_018330640.1 adenosine kinase isoform X1 [Agrilus planipennis]XP_018330641.1 adenosine kinase isoform X1 [Agrilus planipennis]XP_025829836.1 adenosine kinase isoform X2 [Agrilus planipennis]